MKNKRKILVTTFLVIATLSIILPILIDPLSRLFASH